LVSIQYGVERSVNGATYYSNQLINSVFTQLCDLSIKADGAGGSFSDWDNVTNIIFKNYGTFICTFETNVAGNSVLVASNYYNSGEYQNTNEIHDGNGGAAFVGAGDFVYYPNGQNITSAGSQDSTTEVPAGSNIFYSNGQYTNYMYVWDGWGSFYQDGGSGAGSYYSAGTEVSSNLRYNIVYLETEVPSGSGHWENNGKVDFDSYYWNGTGNANSNNYNPNGSFYNYGTYIYYDNNLASDHYWDGNGGYYSEATP
jgi:hypothetical protein